MVDFGNGTLPQLFDRSTFSSISAFLGKGDDTFLATSINGIFDEKVTVDGGTGNDVVIGGQGTDTILLGAGDDQAVWDPGDGSDSVDGQTGVDTEVFHGSNAAEKFVLAANGTHAVLTHDVASIRIDLANTENVDLSTLGSPDSITVGDLSGTRITAVNLDLGTDGAADTVVVNGTNRADTIDVDATDSTVNVTGLHTTVAVSGTEPVGDLLTVAAGGGNDSVSVGDAAEALIGVVVDLGTGQR